MPRVATKLAPTSAGGWFARKRIPEDVRDAYAKLYGVGWEARLVLEPMSAVKARARVRDWLNEIDARVANIRAEQNGEGRTLTSMQTRALAGEWYNWFTAKHLARERTAQFWEAESEAFWADFSLEVFTATNNVDGQANPIELWEDNPKAQARVRPLIADTAEIAQFY